MGLVTRDIDFYARIGQTRRLTAGLLTITVRNNMPALDDLIEYYQANWGAMLAAAKASDHFNGTQPPDPLRTGYKFSAGDNDTFLFFVTVDAILQAHQNNGAAFVSEVDDVLTSNSIEVLDTLPEIGGGYDLSGGAISRLNSLGVLQESGTIDSNDGSAIVTSGITWSDLTDKYRLDDWCADPPTHRKCQSFVRSSLLARHNNAYGHNNDISPVNTYRYNGIKQDEYVVGALADPADQCELTSKQIVNTSVFSDNNFNGIGDDNSTPLDLSTLSNNNYWNPIQHVDIFGSHAFESQVNNFGGGTNYNGPTIHNTDFYNLVVRLTTYGFTDTTAKSFFKNLININWQPIGETSNLQFDVVEFTS